MISGRVGRIWKGLHPRLDGFRSPDEDGSEKVPSGPRDPHFGNEATRFERGRFVVQMVDDEVEDLWRQGGQHRGFHARVVLDAHSPRDRQVPVVHAERPVPIDEKSVDVLHTVCASVQLSCAVDSSRTRTLIMVAPQARPEGRRSPEGTPTHRFIPLCTPRVAEHAQTIAGEFSPWPRELNRSVGGGQVRSRPKIMVEMRFLAFG